MSTPNLGIAHIAASQNQKEVTANAAFDSLDTAMTDTFSYDVSAGGTLTPTAASVVAAFTLKFTGTPPGNTIIVVPANKKSYRIHHAASGGYKITVMVSGQVGVALYPGDTKLVYCNGTDIVVADNTVPLKSALPVDLTNQGAVIAPTALHTAAASGVRGPGIYHIRAYIICTTPDAASSTLPSVQVTYTDNDTGVVQTITITPTNTGNSTTTLQQGAAVISVKASTAINYQTVGYASGTAGAMKYALHIRCDFIG
jgi:hypothetical protein